jgi:hypothetical protein
VHGVGSYLEINVQGTVIWPVELTMYYTDSDLADAGIVESELAGLYYYSSSERTWKLYSESGTDDNGLGPSTTEVHTENITLNDIEYEGYISTIAYHLTTICMGSKVDSSLVEIPSDGAFIATDYYLKQNYPNPFNPITNIEFSIPKSEFVTLKVYNILGEDVATLVSEKLSVGTYQYEWNASNLTSGIYFYRLVVDDFVEVKKMVLMK